VMQKYIFQIIILFLSIETFAWFFICMLQRHQAIIPFRSTCQCSSVIFNRALAVAATLFAAIGPVGFSTCRLS
ncbi:hypothetical protein PMAYCL1PPCAC_04596, partial [Pristionchus mayeri]